MYVPYIFNIVHKIFFNIFVFFSVEKKCTERMVGRGGARQKNHHQSKINKKEER